MFAQYSDPQHLALLNQQGKGFGLWNKFKKHFNQKFN